LSARGASPASRADFRAKVGVWRGPGAAIRKDALDTEDTGFSYHRVKAGQRQPFAHKHERAEEVYVVLAGSGRVKLDDEIVGWWTD
jgi:mannose-6-phosphate isomerase-like protein (cupin superfamily)